MLNSIGQDEWIVLLFMENYSFHCFIALFPILTLEQFKYSVPSITLKS